MNRMSKPSAQNFRNWIPAHIYYSRTENPKMILISRLSINKIGIDSLVAATTIFGFKSGIWTNFVMDPLFAFIVRTIWDVFISFCEYDLEIYKPVREFCFLGKISTSCLASKSILLNRSWFWHSEISGQPLSPKI